MTKIKCVCVWLDETSDPSNPTWIVSRDTIELPGGNAETTSTDSTHDTETEAIEAGRKLADKLALPLYRNPANQPAELVEA